LSIRLALLPPRFAGRHAFAFCCFAGGVTFLRDQDRAGR
jgi:hypothetical protein